MTKSPEEAAVYELTNIGNMQASNSSPHSTVNSSPSSRAKKWTTKFTKFQRGNEKKKKVPPAISPPLQLNTPSIFQRSVSTKSLSDSFRTPTTEQNSLHDFPFRTSSLPRPTSHLYTPHKIENPKTAPLSKYPNASQGSTFTANIGLKELSESDTIPQRDSVFNHKTSLSTKNKRSLIKERCTLCNELISNKSNGERIIELDCKHICHEECLSVSMGNLSNTVSLDFHTVFPECSKCLEEKNQVRQCIPRNDDLKDRLLSHILIHNSASSPTSFQSIDTPLRSSQSPITTPTNQIRSQALFQHTPSSIVPSQDLFNFPLAEPPARKRQPNNIISNASAQNWRLSNNKIRGNSRDHSLYLPNLGRMTSNLDNDMISITTSNTNAIRKPESNQLPLIRSYFTQLLLENFKDTLIDWKVDEEFGLLRMVDKLLVSDDNSNFTTSWCFLFTKALIIVSSEEPTDTLSENVTLGVVLSNLQIFDHLETLNVNTVNPTTLEISYSSNSTLYLTESLSNNTSNIIQKWISGLLDKDLLFNETTITSSLQLPLILKNLGSDSNSTSTFTSLVNSERMVELSSFQRGSGSVLIRRSFYVDSNSQNANPESTMLSMMTSISSILSLKREKPDELFVVLQIDFNKLKGDEDYYTIVNTFKALTMTIQYLKICVINSDGYILQFPVSGKEINDINTIKNWQHLPATSRMDPKSLKNKLYPGMITSNIGVIVISNSNMEEGRSGLLKDYSCFSKNGRHTPNELKVKVGYLNVDYSSKINELLEVDTWDCILETICYSYNISFEEDNDSDSIFLDRNTLSSQSIYQNNEDDDDKKSMITLQISSPIDINRSTVKHEFETAVTNDETENIDLSALNLSDEIPIIESTTPDELKINLLQKKRETYSVVLNQIDEAIQDIHSHETDDLDRLAIRKSFYNYL